MKNRDYEEYCELLGFRPYEAAPAPVQPEVQVADIPPTLATLEIARPVSTEATLADVAHLGELQKIASGCVKCRLCESRTTVVFGEGSPGAALMFVGEAPGFNEDQQGRPFVGPAGDLLTKMIGAMGLSRDEVYIANVIKCRPPENRDPQPDEVAACAPYLQRQIELIGPRVIVALGTFAAQTVLETELTISRMRGKPWPKKIGGHAIQVFPTFHPAYLLRSPEKKKDVWEDLKQVMAFLKSE